MGQLGLAPGDGVVPSDADGIDLLLSGIERAELVNTVSPGFAGEALTPEFGMGLDGALRAKGDRFFGILNGLDTKVWDPATDADQAAPYTRGDRSGKAACRADLLTRIGFDPDDDGPVIGMIGRLDPQKGFDLLADAAPTLLERGARLVVQGSGHPELADPFRAIALANPDRVAFIERFDRVMARKIYAGADFFAMPSRFEPCGQGQMIALALRDAADRASRGRTGRHRDRRDRAPWRRDRLQLLGGDGRADCSPRVQAAIGSTRRRRARVGGPARSRDGSRFRLGLRRGAALPGCVSTSDRDPGPGRRPT